MWFILLLKESIPPTVRKDVMALINTLRSNLNNKITLPDNVYAEI